MILKQLSLARVRAFEQADFDFQPGMNLLVGVNGAGKSTILDVLRTILAYALPQITAAPTNRSIYFTEDDITVGHDTLTVELEFEAAGIPFEHLIHLPRKDFVVDESKEGQVRHQTVNLVERNKLTPRSNVNPASLKQNKNQPLALFFSTRRATYNRAQPTKQRSAGDQAAAYADALAPRGLHIREFAEWWLARQTLAEEKKELGKILDFLNRAAADLLEDCSNLRAVRNPDTSLVVDKAGMTLDVSQLSDGERSLLALALDLGLRLGQANVKFEDPLRDGNAVVLIDELDLHLHPRWQRTIVDKLTLTFPNCQFIATTHSPQIVGEISPDNIILIKNGKATRPDQSLGMDTNWILRHLMGVSERDEDTKQQLEKIEILIEAEQYDEVTVQIDVLRQRLGDFPALVDLQTRIDMIQFLSNAEDE